MAFPHDVTRLTKFERCEIIGTRATLLAQGAAVQLTPEERGTITDPLALASLELQLGRLNVRLHRGDSIVRLLDREFCARIEGR
jgi:DNA-directed RNA polymerase subunit K/omega